MVIDEHEARAAWCREAITLLRELAHPELNPHHAEQEGEAPPPTREEPAAETTQPVPERAPSRRIDLLTLLEMVENGEPIPPWNG